MFLKKTKIFIYFYEIVLKTNNNEKQNKQKSTYVCSPKQTQLFLLNKDLLCPVYTLAWYTCNKVEVTFLAKIINIFNILSLQSLSVWGICRNITINFVPHFALFY